MARTRKQLDYIGRWTRENTVSVLLKLNRANDADIIAHLGGVGNKNGYIKRLIREDIAR